jgi:hypothetical protein
LSDIFFGLLLTEHTHEQLSIYGRRKEREEKNEVSKSRAPATHINITNAGASPYKIPLILTLKVRAQELAIDFTGAIHRNGFRDGGIIRKSGRA